MLVGSPKAQLRDVFEDGQLDDVNELLDSAGIDTGPQLLEVFLSLLVRHGDPPHLLRLQDDHLRKTKEHLLEEGHVEVTDIAGLHLSANRLNILLRDLHVGHKLVDAPLLVVPGSLCLVDEHHGSWFLEVLFTHDTGQALAGEADLVDRLVKGLLDELRHRFGDHFSMCRPGRSPGYHNAPEATPALPSRACPDDELASCSSRACPEQKLPSCSS